MKTTAIEISVSEAKVFDAIDTKFDNINRTLSKDIVPSTDLYHIWQDLKDCDAPLVMQNLAYEAWTATQVLEEKAHHETKVNLQRMTKAYLILMTAVEDAKPFVKGVKVEEVADSF